MYGFAKEGGIPKVIANKIAISPAGEWLLPFWRENDQWDAGASCNARLDLMGVPGVLISGDKVSEGFEFVWAGNHLLSDSLSPYSRQSNLYGGLTRFNLDFGFEVVSLTPFDRTSEGKGFELGFLFPLFHRSGPCQARGAWKLHLRVG